MQVYHGTKKIRHAVVCAIFLINDESVVVILPDVIIDDLSFNLKKDKPSEILANFSETVYKK
ncbi:MAG: hypothetical protein ACFC03_01970 [Candidatus Malihini olakiniferum]